ncbi:V-type ATP synthase subunit I [Pyrofollis japonicus]|uniref:V-type ATP synthase subunit I n=1 Tax=Pyrofollis japonicus TaxID=3060460 RepID=UPI00295B57C0|nr:V-type ATPase 116kDa subunit family protein [Pyrofollis japonicus]BEP17152.1 V-type ATP synthase subunit I [Pyrofollis japonicus]
MALADVLVARPAQEIVVAIPVEQLPRAVKALAECRCLHPEPVTTDPSYRALLHRIRGDLDTLEQKIKQALEVAEKKIIEVEEEEALRLAQETDVGLSRLLEQLGDTIRDIERIAEKLAQLRNPESELSELLRTLQYYSFIRVDLEKLRKGSIIRAKIYRVPLDKADGFRDEASKIEAVVLVDVGIVEPNRHTFIAVYPAWREADIGRVAVRYRAELLEIPRDLPPIPAEALRQAREEVENLPIVLERHIPFLRKALRLVEAAKRLVSILEATKPSKTIALIHGYVANEKLGSLEKALRENNVTYAAALHEHEESHREGHEEEHEEEKLPPSYFRVGNLLAPFADLMGMGGFPRPREIVPAAVMAITLPIIYGLMFPDLGHGLVLALVGYYLFYKKMGNPNLGKLVIVFGIAAMITGFLSGEFFGAEPHVAGWLTSIWGGHPPLASPLHPIAEEMVKNGGEVPEGAVQHLLYTSIYVSLALGSLLLTISSIFSIINGISLRDKEILVAGIGKTLVFGSVALAFLGAPLVIHAEHPLEAAAQVLKDAGLTLSPSTVFGATVRTLFVIGLLVAMIAPIVYGHGGFGERAMTGFMEAFDILLMAIGNTASFMRIMGLMLAHSGLMFGFLILAIISGPIVGAIVYILGNILVIGLEALVAYAHSLRLHFYEMFSKFYIDGGRLYQPVSLPANIKLATD